MASRRSQYVKCPFYKTDEPLRIKCEGFCEGIINAHLIFGLRQACQDYIDLYCNEEYEKCRLYRAVNEKYEEED